MKRKEYVATMHNADTGEIMSTETRYAWNSALRAGEDLVRNHARSLNCYYTGNPATRCDGAYHRDWFPFGGAFGMVPDSAVPVYVTVVAL